jgi:hypothetical protein
LALPPSDNRAAVHAWARAEVEPAVASGAALDVMDCTLRLTISIVAQAGCRYVLPASDVRQMMVDIREAMQEYGIRRSDPLRKLFWWLHAEAWEAKRGVSRSLAVCAKVLRNYTNTPAHEKAAFAGTIVQLVADSDVHAREECFVRYANTDQVAVKSYPSTEPRDFERMRTGLGVLALRAESC